MHNASHVVSMKNDRASDDEHVIKQINCCWWHVEDFYTRNPVACVRIMCTWCTSNALEQMSVQTNVKLAAGPANLIFETFVHVSFNALFPNELQRGWSSQRIEIDRRWVRRQTHHCHCIRLHVYPYAIAIDRCRKVYLPFAGQLQCDIDCERGIFI